MRILGADGFLGGTGQDFNESALDQISTDYLVDGDCAMAKYNDKFYWFILVDNHGGPENIPYIIRPKVGGNASMRWVLKNIFIRDIEVDTVYTNNIYPLSGGDTINLNDVVTLSGDTFIFNNTTEAPFIVNSQVMVENLNAEYWGGLHYTEFDLSSLVDTGDQWIPQGVNTIYVAFPEQRFSSTYSLITELSNIVSGTQSLFTYMITEKTNLGFTVTLSSRTDNPYYRLQWAILGENVAVESYNLQDVVADDIQDAFTNQLTVL